MRFVLRLCVLVSVLFAGLSCSQYDREWRAAQTVATNQDPFAGSYRGQWISNRYVGAAGKLWCILSREGPDFYRADFRATWHGIFSSRHTVLLRINERQREAGATTATFSGAAQIQMWIGSGRYSCAGKMTASGIVADYDAEYDRGKFQLTRVLPSTEAGR